MADLCDRGGARKVGTAPRTARLRRFAPVDRRSEGCRRSDPLAQHLHYDWALSVPIMGTLRIRWVSARRCAPRALDPATRLVQLGLELLCPSQHDQWRSPSCDVLVSGQH